MKQLAANTLIILICSLPVYGQRPTTPAAGGKDEAQTITVERQALTLQDPARYRTAISLQAARRVVVTAQMSGVVANVYQELGQDVKAQEELVRLDQRERQLELDEKQALYLLAVATANSGASPAENEPRTAAAKAALDLAKLRYEATQIRSPLAGKIINVAVQEGDYVQAGSPIMTVVDASTLTTLIPVERSATKAGDKMTVQVEGQGVEAKVNAILPPPPEMESLRDLYVSLAAASVSIDNSAGKLAVGQSVLSEMIPRHPIAEVPNQSIINATEGQRKVQVIRDGFVRDLTIQLLGNVGDTHVYVSARFQAGDELIASSSTPLTDGTWLRPKLAVLEGATGRGKVDSRSRNSDDDPNF
ncbi:MAG: HlyD family efflux transporter periplasmic adaptor subunit [Planctomycetaceae bacterium]|nr:HlyD family efflux transporter periplasmic adaptor subunit [Planctomycetaceae bacterium]MCA9042971.1 HlyD family efflux transporter periplasmic adaptor subunit [Planctomycetaceae bacterium]MCB9952720.1 HlyD family efflux transporter periplasmic adaptor subunit [Planctomycetaceae bacterium]